jgi:hypothetical protein
MRAERRVSSGDVEYDCGKRAGAALTPGAYDYETIGAFYDTIRAAFSALSEELGDKRLFTAREEK